MKTLSDYAAEMKRDWNERAHENAKWFINTFKIEQTEDEFSSSCMNDIQWNVLGLLDALTWQRDARQLRLLEIGCGIGRMTSHLAGIFGEVHGVDVSGEMVEQGRARLKHLPNVFFHETSGVDFAEFADGFFDVAFTAYVFQHMPDQEVIKSNIRDGYRVLAPGGVFRYMSAGVMNDEYRAMPKNTWTGAPFGEADSRQIARELGAQLITLHGEDTQYFWTMLRKPMTPQPTATPLRLLAAGRVDDVSIQDIPTRGEQALLALHVAGISAELVDCNNLRVEWQGHTSSPVYVTPLTGTPEAVLIRTRVPVDLATGQTAVRLLMPDGRALETTVNILQSPIPPPVIMQFSNAADAGLDVFTSGPKSVIRVFAVGFEGEVSVENTLMHIGELALKPAAVSFLPANGAWEIRAQLPSDISAQKTEVRVSHFGRLSPPHALEIQTLAENG